MPVKQFIAVRAVIRDEKGKILIIRESGDYKDGNNLGRWDFPGGKVDLGETCEDALRREVMEEAGLEIEVEKPFFVSEWRPKIGGEQVQIIGIFFLCNAKKRNVELSQDHDFFAWIDPNNYSQYDLIPQKRDAIEFLLKNP